METNTMEKQPLLEAQRNPNGHEPSLTELQKEVFEAQRRYMRAWSKTTSGIWHKRIMYSVSALLLMFMIFCITIIAQDSLSSNEGGWNLDKKVVLEAHIMSKCPDARDCLHDMILPAMQRVSDKVDFRLSYIGSETDHDDGILCKHGPSECLGNIIEICAAHLYPDPKIYLGFTMCLTKDYQDIPERSLVEDCALEHGVSMDKLNKCTVDEDGALSVDMLKASFNRSATAGVTKSCTIRLNNHIRCIRDDGEWKNCTGGHKPDDLVRDILSAETLISM